MNPSQLNPSGTSSLLIHFPSSSLNPSSFPFLLSFTSRNTAAVQITVEIQKLQQEHDETLSVKTEECKAKVAELMVPEPPPQERRRSQLNPSYSTKALSYETLYYSEMSPSASFGSSLNLTLTRVIFRFFFSILFSILFSIYLILFLFFSFYYFIFIPTLTRPTVGFWMTTLRKRQSAGSLQPRRRLRRRFCS